MKNLRLYIILAVLITIAGIFYFSNTKGTLNLRNASFAIKSPDAILRIALSSSDQRLVLEKKSGDWKVNNKYRATDKYVQNLKEALSRIAVLTPVSKAERQQVASILKKDGILVEVFGKRRSIGKFYVGKPSMNREKTYMMMEDSNEPFITHIPAFKGLIAELFVLEESYWRNKIVFDYKPQNIETIRVEYPWESNKSFKAINYHDGTFAIRNIGKDEFLQDFNVDKLARYFTYYQRIVFEDVVVNLTQTEIDSVLNSTAFSVISVKDDSNHENKITIYRKPATIELDEFGNKVRFDYDLAYATLNNNQELITIQYYIFDPLLKEIDYFR